MAQRRMFNLKVVETDRFLEMPTSAQCLYFHLGMHGDDDGFVSSPNRIAVMCGCNPDDLKLLIAKKFVYRFESGVCVIMDWKVNNTLKNDRYTPTIYKEEYEELAETFPELAQQSSKMVPSRVPDGAQMDPKRIHSGDISDPQHNITTHNITEPIGSAPAEPAKRTRKRSAAPKKRKYGEFGHVMLTDEEYEKLRAYPASEEYITKVDRWCEQKGKKYKNYYLAILDWMERDGVKAMAATAAAGPAPGSLAKAAVARMMQQEE